MKKNNDLGILLSRIAIGFPMLVYGISKIFSGIDFIKTLLLENGLPPILGYGVYVGEVFAPLLIIIGFRTRIAGLIFATNCLCAILLAQNDNIFKLNSYGGWALELLAIFMLVALSLMVSGAGKYSLSSKNKWD